MTQLVVRAVIAKDDKFLLVRNKGNDFWCLPGGKVDADEPIVQALERELVEELGVHPVVGQLLYVQQLIQPGEDQRVEFFFLINNSEDYRQVDIEQTTHGSAELAEAGFYNLHEVKVLPAFLADELPQLLRGDFSAPLPIFR